ncbi:MAG: hypothetical protein ACYDH1_14520 [Anaerolineaceae bacterium]
MSNSPLLTIAKGCLLSILPLIAIFIGGLLFTYLLSKNPINLSSDASLPLIFLFLSAAFGISARSFIRNTIASFTIRGILEIPDFKFIQRKSSGVLKNPIIVKFIVAMSVLIFSYLLVTMLAMFSNLSDKPQAAFTQIFVILIGGFSGLLLAILVFVRTVPSNEHGNVETL